MTAAGLQVLIATHGRPDLLARTLDSLADCAPPGALREVLVVENGGRSGVEDACAARGARLPMRYMFVEEGRKSKALNAGLATLGEGLVWFLDDDVRLDPRAPAAYLDAATRYGGGHHFGGPIHIDRDDRPPEWLRPYLPSSALGWYQGDVERYYDDPYFIGSNWAAFRDDLMAVGGLPEHLGPGVPSGALGDEVELQGRLLGRGGRGVYLPTAAVWHHVPDQVWTVEWARRRQYRMGVTNVLMGQRAAAEGPRIAGAPLGLWKEYAVLGLRALVARALRVYPARGLHADMRFHETRGALAANRLAAPSRGGGVAGEGVVAQQL